MLNSAEQRLPCIYDHTAARALLKRTTEMKNAAQGRPALGVRRSAGIRERERQPFAERLPEGGRLVV